MSTVHQVRENIRQCRACDLHKVGNGPVPFSGPTPNFVTVIGEAPGAQEDRQGKPFVGPAGELLRNCLEGAGFDPEQMTYINTVCCFPNRTPNMGEINACSTNLLAQLEHVNPAWAVLLGNVALSSQRPDLKITRTRGKVLVPPPNDVFVVQPRWKFFVTFHPSFALRQARAEKILRSDLERLAAMIDMGFDTDEPRSWVAFTDDSCVSCGATPDEIDEHDGHLRFDEWDAPFCDACWPSAPQNRAEKKETERVERHQEKTGSLFK